MTEPTQHPADAEAARSEPVQQQGREHNPAEQVQPPDADVVDLYGE